MWKLKCFQDFGVYFKTHNMHVKDGRRVKQNEQYKPSGVYAAGFSYLI
jgi:hypothetical protein